MTSLESVSRQENLLLNCYKCNNGIKNGWKSQFLGDHHYKTTSCETCGYNVHVKVDFHGSGHDDWINTEKSRLLKPKTSLDAIINKDVKK